MDQNLYQTKLNTLLQHRSLVTIYQYMHKTKTWKVVNRRCSYCNTGFNKNTNKKFETHICKKNYMY